MRVIRTNRTAREVEADIFVAFSVADVQGIRIACPFTRSLYRYCPEAFRAVRASIEKKGCELGKGILTKDRLYWEKKKKRLYDVYVLYIPIKPDASEDTAKKEHIISALNEMERVLIGKISRIRVCCMNDPLQDAAQEDLFELDLFACKLFNRLWNKGIKLIMADGDVYKHRAHDEYGFISRFGSRL